MYEKSTNKAKLSMIFYYYRKASYDENKITYRDTNGQLDFLIKLKQ